MSFGLIEKCPHPATSLLDRTGDGIVSITDIWMLAGDVLRLPGELIISMAAKSPDLISFFELTCKSADGTASTIISIVVWLVILLGLANANS